MRKHILGRIGYARRWLPLSVLLAVSSAASGEFIAEGVVLTPLTDDGRSVAATWAKRGNLIAFIREVSKTQSQLLLMQSDGSGEVAITSVGNPIFAEWSWSGTKLSYEYTNARDRESQGGVSVYDVLAERNTSISVPYLRGALDPDDGPFWSPDDRYVVYKARPGIARTRELWVWDSDTGKTIRLLPTRGQGKEQRWNSSLPPKICLLIEADGGSFDVATVNPDGSELVLLTDIGAQSIRADSPRWSPTGEWVAFTSGQDMTQNERERGREDCWIGRPDGSEVRNLTKASSPATEKQLAPRDLYWSWDGRWILMTGSRFDNAGNRIGSLFLVDPVNGGYRPILTSHPRETAKYDSLRAWTWSYDSTKIAVLLKRSVVRNWGPDAEFEQPHWILGVYDMRMGQFEALVDFDEELDRKMIRAETDRDDIADISWSPDNHSILLSVSKIVSKADEIFQPDVYRLDLPERLIDPSSARHAGPPFGLGSSEADTPAEATPQAPLAPDAPPMPSMLPSRTGDVMKTIVPAHMTVGEAMASLPADYAQYVTTNAARNLMLFEGSKDVLEDLEHALEMIDTVVPHVLVDLLAVELSDEANRNLGLDWTYAEGRFGFFLPEGAAIRDLTPDEGLNGLITFPGRGQGFYQGVGQLPREFFVRLNMLVKDGDATILANPRTVSMSGRESLIQIRKTVNFFFNEGFDTAGRPIVKKSDISADTLGRITPTLLPNGQIHLLVDVGVGTFTFTAQEKLPEQTNRQSTTEVIVQEGETIVIGGLRQQETVQTTTKIPLLSYIPIIKPLFTKRTLDVRHSVLTIFITPQILAPGEPAPEWPQLLDSDYPMVPIMEETPKNKRRTNRSVEQRYAPPNPKPGGPVTRWFRRISR
jgi:Tol biopolymer transport system component